MKSKPRLYTGPGLPASDKSATDCRQARHWIEDANFRQANVTGKIKPCTRAANRSPQDGTPNRAYRKAHPEFYCGPMAQDIDRKPDGTVKPRLIKRVS